MAAMGHSCYEAASGEEIEIYVEKTTNLPTVRVWNPFTDEFDTRHYPTILVARREFARRVAVDCGLGVISGDPVVSGNLPAKVDAA